MDKKTEEKLRSMNWVGGYEMMHCPKCGAITGGAACNNVLCLRPSIEAEKNVDYKKAHQIVYRQLRIARKALEYLAVHQDSITAKEALEEMQNEPK